jgi:hypothetical protein
MRVIGKRPLVPGLQAAAGAPGYLEDSRAAPVCLHLKRPAVAELDRQPRQRRIEKIGVLA